MRKRKLPAIIVTVGILLLTFTAGASAASTLERIQANLNHGISFVLGGEVWTPKDANGNKAAPISYQGTTYVPLRAVAEATGAEVSFDAAKQQINISVAGQTEESKGERVPFSSSNVSHHNWIYSDGGVTRNKADLLFGETQYQTAFTVTGVNSATQGVAFKVKEGTKKVGVLIGFKSNIQKDGTYKISNKDGQTFATGEVGDGKVTDNVLELPKGVTELYVEFTAAPGDKATGFLIWDESWLEN